MKRADAAAHESYEMMVTTFTNRYEQGVTIMSGEVDSRVKDLFAAMDEAR